MLCGYNTNGLQNHRLDDALRLLAEFGYEAVGLTLDVLHLDPFDPATDAAKLRHTRDLLADCGLHPVIETGARYLLDPRAKHEPTLMTRDPGRRKVRVEFYDRAAEIGAQLGAEVLSFWAGVDWSPDGDSFDWLCEGVAATCAKVRARGLEPALEPEPGMAVNDLRDYARLCEALGADAPSLALDIGHLYVNESEPSAALIERWGPRIRQVHLEDMRRGVHVHLVPGEGDVDFEGDLRALAATGFRGAVCFELSRSSHMAPESLRVCRNVWDDARR